MIDFSSITPGELQDLARLLGWELGSRKGDLIEVWKHPSRPTIRLPLRPDLPDYTEMVADVFYKLSRYMHRPEAALANMTSGDSFDVIQMRNSSRKTREGTIAIDNFGVWIKSVYDAFLASACSIIEPRRFFTGRRPDMALDYVKNIQVVPPRAGSFIMTFLAPLQMNEFMDSMPNISYGRRATMRFMASLSEAVRLADTPAELSQFIDSREGLESLAERGVNSNLCNALAELPLQDNDSVLQVTIQWAPGEVPNQHLSQQVTIKPRHIGVLTGLGERLRYLQPLDDIELSGRVTNLARKRSRGPGVINAWVNFDERKKRLRVSLEENYYEQAVSAHRQGFHVAVRGRLEIISGRLRMEFPTLRVIQPEQGIGFESGEGT